MVVGIRRLAGFDPHRVTPASARTFSSCTIASFERPGKVMPYPRAAPAPGQIIHNLQALRSGLRWLSCPGQGFIPSTCVRFRPAPQPQVAFPPPAIHRAFDRAAWQSSKFSGIKEFVFLFLFLFRLSH